MSLKYVCFILYTQKQNHALGIRIVKTLCHK